MMMMRKQFLNGFIQLIAMNVKKIEFVHNNCSNYRSHRLLVACNYCQNDFKTFNDRDA